MEILNTKLVIELSDDLDTFKSDYVNKMLEKRDQMWHARKGQLKDDREAAMYEDVRIKSEFLESLYNRIQVLMRIMAVDSHYMEKYLKVIDDMKIAENGKFRESLFAEQRKELEQITDTIRKIYDYNTTVYEETTK